MAAQAIRRLGTYLMTKIALESVCEQATVASDAALSWKEQLLEQAARAFNAGAGLVSQHVRCRVHLRHSLRSCAQDLR